MDESSHSQIFMLEKSFSPKLGKGKRGGATLMEVRADLD
jgi:hypothetical protein